MYTTKYSKKLVSHLKEYPHGKMIVRYDPSLCMWCIYNWGKALQGFELSAFHRERECWRRLREVGCIKLTRQLWEKPGNVVEVHEEPQPSHGVIRTFKNDVKPMTQAAWPFDHLIPQD